MPLFTQLVPNPPYDDYKAERVATKEELGRLAEEYRNTKAEWDAREVIGDTDPFTHTGDLERDLLATRYLLIEDEYDKAMNAYHKAELEKLFDVH